MDIIKKIVLNRAINAHFDGLENDIPMYKITSKRESFRFTAYSLRDNVSVRGKIPAYEMIEDIRKQIKL